MRASTRAITAVFNCSLVAGALAATPQRPFPMHVAYATGSIRPNHRTQSRQDDDVRALYNGWRFRYLAQAGTESDGHPRYRVRSGRTIDARTVSEGQGYGMILVVLMAGYDSMAQTIFDGLWEFSKDHRSNVDSRLMDWSVEADEQIDPSGNNSAFDGDCDIAFALLLAEKQWGNSGRFNYGFEAGAVIDGILQSTVGPQSDLPMLGDWVDPNGAKYHQRSPRPSDFMPHHFRTFGRIKEASRWSEVVQAVQKVVTEVQNDYSRSTGLLPDFLEPVPGFAARLRPASPNFLEGPNDGYFYYNAVRAPWRLGTDALLSGDPTSTAQTRKMAQWVHSAAGGDPAKISSGYHLDGTVISGAGYFSTLFAAGFAVAAMSEPSQQKWLNALYDLVRTSDEDYYEDTVSLLCLLVLTGNFWGPVDLLTAVAPNEVHRPAQRPISIWKP